MRLFWSFTLPHYRFDSPLLTFPRSYVLRLLLTPTPLSFVTVVRGRSFHAAFDLLRLHCSVTTLRLHTRFSTVSFVCGSTRFVHVPRLLHRSAILPDFVCYLRTYTVYGPGFLWFRFGSRLRFLHYYGCLLFTLVRDSFSPFLTVRWVTFPTSCLPHSPHIK